jgi:carbon-monoxide dehydrogenase medium subunit
VPDPRFSLPDTVDAALTAMAGGGVPLAGATWAMRAPLRKEPAPGHLVALGGIADLAELSLYGDRLHIGAMVTHERLAVALSDAPDLLALAEAARKSANPCIRRLTTVGGNLCASGFAAADLVPALLSLEARVQLRTLDGDETLGVAEFLHRRTGFAEPWLLTSVTVPRSGWRSAHIRLPMRKAGDYPCAIVSVSAALDADSLVSDLRIAVGSVEPVARRWPALETALQGRILSPGLARTHAKALAADFTGRDAVDAPGWYRISVLPALVHRAVQSLLEQTHEH